MSKDQKKTSERKHRMVQKLLVEAFPDCEVKYDGVEGIDHTIFYPDFPGLVTQIETKTCKKIIKCGVKLPADESPYLLQNIRLGRLYFNQAAFYPYTESQHDDLVKNNGWYVFVIGELIAGAPACDIDRIFTKKHDKHEMVWHKILALCRPDWLENLKKQVYGRGV